MDLRFPGSYKIEVYRKGVIMMKKHCFVFVLFVLFANICAAQQTQTQATEPSFYKVKHVYGQGKKQKEKDARLVFANEKLLITDDNEPRKELYAEIPTSFVKRLVYENSSKPSWKAPWSFLSKGKKHWLTIYFGKTEERQDAVVLLLPEDSYQKIVSTIEGETRLQAEMIVAD
jgi:hypothetical protein